MCWDRHQSNFSLLPSEKLSNRSVYIRQSKSGAKDFWVNNLVNVVFHINNLLCPQGIKTFEHREQSGGLDIIPLSPNTRFSWDYRFYNGAATV